MADGRLRRTVPDGAESFPSSSPVIDWKRVEGARESSGEIPLVLSDFLSDILEH